jgi:hypothetical protein
VSELGKAIIGFGLLITVIGVVVMLAGRLGVHRLPGDIVVRRGNFTFFFPIVSCILVSIILTIVLNLIFRRR